MNNKKEFADKLLSEPLYKKRLRMIKEMCVSVEKDCIGCIFDKSLICMAYHINKVNPGFPTSWDLQEDPEPEKPEVKMTRKRLKKLWKYKKVCEKQNSCIGCKYSNNTPEEPICSLLKIYKERMVPLHWNLPPLPKKKRFKYRFVLGEKIDKKLNKDIVRALYIKGYYSITCNVWDYDKKNKNEEEIISITSDCRYISESGFDFMHAEPVERNGDDE